MVQLWEEAEAKEMEEVEDQAVEVEVDSDLI